MQNGCHSCHFEILFPTSWTEGHLTPNFFRNIKLTCSNYSPEVTNDPTQGSLVWCSSEQYRVLAPLFELSPTQCFSSLSVLETKMDTFSKQHRSRWYSLYKVINCLFLIIQFFDILLISSLFAIMGMSKFKDMRVHLIIQDWKGYD